MPTTRVPCLPSLLACALACSAALGGCGGSAPEPAAPAATGPAAAAPAPQPERNARSSTAPTAAAADPLVVRACCGEPAAR